MTTAEDLRKINPDLHIARAMIEWNLKKEEVTPELRMKAKKLNLLILYGANMSLASRLAYRWNQ